MGMECTIPRIMQLFNLSYLEFQELKVDLEDCMRTEYVNIVGTNTKFPRQIINADGIELVRIWAKARDGNKKRIGSF